MHADDYGADTIYKKIMIARFTTDRGSRMSGWLGVTIVGVLALLLSGCPGNEQRANSLSLRGGLATAVVADLSSGTNPYHKVFRRPWFDHPSAVIPGFPPDAPALHLTLGPDWNQDVAADESLWASMKTDRVYWVPGTNLLLYRSTPGAGLVSNPSDRPIYDDDHGTGTAAAITKQCYSCYVLVMQDVTNAGGETAKIIAETMPWVDLVTSTQVSDFTAQELADFAVPNKNSSYSAATRDLADSGRLFFAATGNTPVTGIANVTSPLPIQNWDLPPWVIAVGGAHSECSSVEAFAGHPSDFVGDFGQVLAVPGSVSEETYRNGTSFATPQVAASFAEALIGVRRSLGDSRAPKTLWAGTPGPAPYLEDGQLTARELYDAMSKSARYFHTEDYDSQCALNRFSITPGVPAGPQPWIDMGWGYVGSSEAFLATNLVLGRQSVDEKPADAVTFMAAFAALRSLIYGDSP